MANDALWVEAAPEQSNSVGTATAASAGGAGQDANAGDARRFADLAACTYYQLSADLPAVPGSGNPQVYNTNVGPIPMRPYAASGNNIGSAYPTVYLGLKHGLFANPMYAVHAVGSTGLLTHWDKTALTTLYADSVAFLNARVAEAGRPIDVYTLKFFETDANTPASITNFSARLTNHINNLKADVAGITSNTLFVMTLVNPNANLAGDGDVAGMRAAQIAFVNANSASWVGVDPFLVPVAADPHYRSDGYWSVGEAVVNAVRARKFPTNRLDVGVGPSPWVQADGPLATTQNATSNLRPRGARGHVGELAARNDYQLMAVLGYTAATTHTVITPATFTQIGTLNDSVFSTSHRTLSVYGRPVVDTAMVSDAFGRRVMPTPAVRVDTSVLNEAQIVTIANTDPINPLAGFYFGTNDANTATLSVPKVAPGTPMVVKPGDLVVALIAENGATQTVTALSNPDTGAWTIHRDQVVNPGAGSVGFSFASAVCTGTQLRQTTITYGLAGVQNAGVFVFNMLNTADVAGANIGADTASATAAQINTADVLASIGTDTASATMTAVNTATVIANIGADTASATASSTVTADVLAILAADVAISTASQTIGIDVIATIGIDQAVISLSAVPIIYCSVQELVNAIGADALRQLSDLDNRGIVDNDRVIAAIQTGDAIINSYIGKRYAVPLVDVPQTINQLSIKWALRTLRDRAYKVQPLQEDIEADKVDREWLAGVAKGTISIGVDLRPPKASDRIDVGAAPRDSSRGMSLRRMKGFI